MPMKATDKQFSLRLPIAMYEEIETEAKKQERSVNFLILQAIKEWLEQNKAQQAIYGAKLK